MQVGSRIRQLYDNSKLGIDQFAKKMGVSRTAVYDWFKADDLKGSLLLQLAEFFGVTVHYLVTGEHPENWRAEDHKIEYHFGSHNENLSGNQNFFSGKDEPDYKKEYYKAMEQIQALQTKLNEANESFRELSLSMLRTNAGKKK